jgi:LuxR family transcriptional regulator, maltose regulon positive regulatory protein
MTGPQPGPPFELLPCAVMGKELAWENDYSTSSHGIGRIRAQLGRGGDGRTRVLRNLLATDMPVTHSAGISKGVARSGRPPDMAEQAPAARSDASGSEQDALLATKLYLPGNRAGFVPRPRLADRLEEGLDRKLLLVSAPAGSGKSALLADWARRNGRPVAWLSLDPGDNDPVRFWRHAAAALDQARPGIAERVGPLLGPPAPRSFEGVVTAVINEIAAQPDAEILFFLDDYHLISSQRVHESLVFLLEHLPRGLHLVLASRADPPLGVARLRAGADLAELRAADLRFTPEEAAALLRRAAGADLPDAAVTELAARTEGWAAGLQLAGLSLRGRRDIRRFVEAFSGSNRYVLDYLAGEVLDRQRADLREFLLETSVLDRLSGALCDAVTGRHDGQAMLEEVERANLFLVPLDEVRGWWRYHHLFADLLRARLNQEQPGRAPHLRRAAALWCEEHGLASEAIGYALASQDPVLAAKLIETHFDAFFYARAEGPLTQRWLTALPADVVAARPRLLLAQAAIALLSGQMDEVEALLDRAERTAADFADEPYEPSAGKSTSFLVNIPARIALDRAYVADLRGDAAGTAALATRALAEIREGEKMLKTHAVTTLAMADWLRGRLAEAERGFGSCLAAWRACGRPANTLAAWACRSLGQIQKAQGRLEAARQTYQQATEITAGFRQAAAPMAGTGHVGLAEVAYARGELDSALRHADEGIARSRDLVYTPLLATGLAVLAWIRQARADPAGALDAMDEAARLAPNPAIASLLNPVPAERARLLLAQGDVAEAARWVDERDIGPDDEPDYPRESEHLMLARVLIAQDLPAPALTLLERLHAAAAAQGRVHSVITTRALQALALASAGQEARAINTLAEALTLGFPEGHVRVFADEGPPMRALLGRLAAAQRTQRIRARSVPASYLARIGRAFDLKPAEPGTAAAVVPAGLAEPLTSRERQVLGLLAGGQANRDIADELVVTLDTVKRHVSHILAKLGAANRTEAVARARELNLIS